MRQDELKTTVNESDKDIIYSKTLKAGKRIYYLDVKKNLRNDLFIVITESKKKYSDDHSRVTYDKHKIFLFKEDFEKFMNGMNDVIEFIADSNMNVKYEVHSTEDNKAK